MGKYILLAATERDCSCKRWCKGDWRATKYVLYNDGTCYRITECVEEPQRTMFFRMNADKFEKMKDLLDNQFDRAEASLGCDGIHWEMHHYAPSGKLLHSIRGHIYGISALEELCGILSLYA